ncbi:acyl-CoA synthetase [Sphingomonas bacterium]|uniref:acyl-CoA synthetase n=1 Tax=Sphingomonas bacterium TaxID=1895847 RepID=UPI0034A01B89
MDTRFVAQHDAPEAVVIAGMRTRSHAEIRHRAAQVAQGFNDLGIVEGGTVALLLRNDLAFFEATLGAALAGAYPVPINWHATADEAGYILRDCSAKALVVHTDLLPGIVAAVPPGLPILVVDTPPEIRRAYRVSPLVAPVDGVEGWEAWLRRQAPIAAPSAANRAAVIYTSGTTGQPKGVKRGPTPPNPAAAIGYGFGADEARTVLMNGPMYHSAPNSYGMLALAKDARIVLQPRFDAEEMLALIERYRVSHMHIVPTMFVRLLRLPPAVKDRYDLSSLRFVVHGAAPCPPAVKRAMIDWWGPVIHEYYGSTETGLATAHGSAEALARPGTAGRALPGVEIRVLDDGGTVLPPGGIGDVFVRSSSTAAFAYIGRDDPRRADGFVTVGDIGYLDDDGYLFLRDRRRDMIISGGVNIYPAEVEAALLAMSGVRDCAVFGVPDAEFGEAVRAHVEVEAHGPDAAAMREALASSLSRFKIPRTIEIAAALPREDSGKIFKRKLREPYWVAAGRTI